jgi:hypothetical protein
VPPFDFNLAEKCTPGHAKSPAGAAAVDRLAAAEIMGLKLASGL